jgi:hypothetical protein
MQGLADNGKYLMDQHEVRACIVHHASVHPLLIENENRMNEGVTWIRKGGNEWNPEGTRQEWESPLRSKAIGRLKRGPERQRRTRQKQKQQMIRTAAAETVAAGRKQKQRMRI